MSTITLRIPDAELHALDTNARAIHVARSEYIRRAIQYLNKEVKKAQSAKRLQQASLLVRENSMRINAEFSEIEHDPEV